MQLRERRVNYLFMYLIPNISSVGVQVDTRQHYPIYPSSLTRWGYRMVDRIAALGSLHADDLAGKRLDLN
jgi:hypothetical protein